MIASIVRAVMAIKQPQSIAPILLWSMVEETVATVVANAPILRVLVFRGRSFGSSGQPSNTGYTREGSRHDNFELAVTQKNGVVAAVSSPKERTQVGSPDNSLMVLRKVEVTIESERADERDEDESSFESSTLVVHD